MKVDAVSFSFAGDKYLGRPYSEMDCQAFVERCMRDVGLSKDLAGSNAWYREVMRHGWVGSPEECMRLFGQIPKGALLFILKQDDKEPSKYHGDGIGNASHIGICIQRHDGAINSSSSRGQVCYSKFNNKSINGGWNRVGLYDQFDYGNSVNWILEHGGERPPEEGGDEPMQGKVTAETGRTVNLRKAPDGDLIDRIPVGSPVTVTDYGPEWCRVETCGKTGYMMTKFIALDGDITPGEDDRDDFDPGDLDEGTVVIEIPISAAANAYPFLRALCEQIEAKVGRG